MPSSLLAEIQKDRRTDIVKDRINYEAVND